MKQSTPKTKKISLTIALIVAMGMAYFAGTANADQPRMQVALDALIVAEKQLEQASHDKGGHRVAALKLVRQAKKQVKQGIQYDRRH